MCRFVFYRGPTIQLASLVTEPAHSLIHQSFHADEREEPLNGDGFGLAWWVDGDPQPALFRSVTPAWSNANLLELARVTRSRCVMAHVRAATLGLSVAEVNCHPFRRGRFAFMHNGDIGGFEKLRRTLYTHLSDESFAAVQGSTDSEHLFALILDELAGEPEPDDCHGMAAALRRALRTVLALADERAPGTPSYVNAVLSNGIEAVGCRITTDPGAAADTLYWHAGRRYVCEDGLCRMVSPGAEGRAVMITSERLSADAGWETVPVNHLVLVDREHGVTLEPYARG